MSKPNFYLLKFILINLFSIFPSQYAILISEIHWKNLIAPFFSLHDQFFFQNWCNKFVLPSTEMNISTLNKSRSVSSEKHLDNNISLIVTEKRLLPFWRNEHTVLNFSFKAVGSSYNGRENCWSSCWAEL